MISVIIIDDHPLVLNGFEFILKNTSTIVLRGSFSSTKDAFEFLTTEAVDVILMDINMPEMNGIDATEIIKKNIQIHGSLPSVISTREALPYAC